MFELWHHDDEYPTLYRLDRDVRIARQLVEGLAQAYKQAHSEEPDLQQPPPSAAG
jgi:uncharacterized protein involved in exopolysaccharide biosynthesis